MGNCGGSQATSAEMKQEQTSNKQIEAQLKKDKKQMEREVKLLLLGMIQCTPDRFLRAVSGAGESGKSTIAKQMRIIYLEGFTTEDRLRYREVICSNVVTCMRALIFGCRRLEIELDKDNQDIADALADSMNTPTELPPQLVAELKRLWQDHGIQSAFARQNEFQLFDCTE